MSVSGYIDLNKQEIHSFDPYEHFEFVRKHYSEDYEIEEILQDIDDTMEACEQLADEGEHPEWHNYEMALDSGKWEITQILMRRNIFRFNCRNNVLYFITLVLCSLPRTQCYIAMYNVQN